MIIKKSNKKILNNQNLSVEKQLDVPLVSELTEDVNSDNLVEQEFVEESTESSDDIFAGFNFDEIVFNQRAERRRGDRRRGYRRIDERNLVSRAQQEAITIKEEASKEGYENGLKSAAESIEELKKVIDEFFAYKDIMYEKLSTDILEISIKVAEKIIKKEVELSNEVLNSIVSDALKTLAKDENKIILKVNPTDVEYAKELVPNLLSSGQFEAKIFVTGDMEVDEGSAVIETSNGVIDANLSTQLELIKEAFKQI